MDARLAGSQSGGEVVRREAGRRAGGDGPLPVSDARRANEQVAGRREEQRRGESAGGNRGIPVVAKTNRENAARLFGGGESGVCPGRDEAIAEAEGEVDLERLREREIAAWPGRSR